MPQIVQHASAVPGSEDAEGWASERGRFVHPDVETAAGSAARTYARHGMVEVDFQPGNGRRYLVSVERRFADAVFEVTVLSGERAVSARVGSVAEILLPAWEPDEAVHVRRLVAALVGETIEPEEES